MKKLFLLSISILGLLSLTNLSFATCDDDTCIIDPDILIKGESVEKTEKAKENKSIVDDDFLYTIPTEDTPNDIDYYMAGVDKNKVKNTTKLIDSPELERIKKLSAEEQKALEIENQTRELEIENNMFLEENQKNEDKKDNYKKPLIIFSIWGISLINTCLLYAILQMPDRKKK